MTDAGTLRMIDSRPMGSLSAYLSGGGTDNHKGVGEVSARHKVQGFLHHVTTLNAA
jgi:hypothetical protein